MRRVVFDTSILLLLYDGVDVFSWVEHVLDTVPECIVPSTVIRELEKLASSKRLHKRRAARLALQAVERKCRVLDVKENSVDDALVAIALRDCEAIIATADNELRRRLRERGIPNIYYRRAKHGLELEGS